uniref:Uncharacterized protein n=1 Tax=Arundo donax TaxID=35708 RepID=A0A0A9F473_ARUDO
MRQTNKSSSMVSKNKKLGVWHQWLPAKKSVETKANKEEECRGRALRICSEHEISMCWGSLQAMTRSQRLS